MNDLLATFLLNWLFWWVTLFIVYTAVLFGVDALLTAWKRRREARRRHQAELDRINREVAAAVQIIGTAFVVAQQLVREEVAASRSARQ